MTQQITHETKKKLETAVLVGVHAQNDNEFNFDSTMEELKALSLTCQLDVKDKLLKIENKSIINITLVKVRLMNLKLLLNSMI